MLNTHPIEAEGRLLGVAVQSAADWHVVAVDPAIEDLHGMRFPCPADAARVAGVVIRRGRRVAAARVGA